MGSPWRKDRRRVRGTVPTTVDGIRFDSRREARRYSELLMLERAGEIERLELQHRIYLEGRDGPILTPKGRRMSYVADFRYWDAAAAAWVLEDAKGHPTDVYQIKKAILAAMGVEIREV